MPMTWDGIVSIDSVTAPWFKVMKSGRPFCPDKNDIFKAFSYCSPDNCKVVFLGQDLLFIIRKLIRVLYF